MIRDSYSDLATVTADGTVRLFTNRKTARSYDTSFVIGSGFNVYNLVF